MKDSNSNLTDDAVAVNGGTNSGNGGNSNPDSGGCNNSVSDGMGDHKTPDSCGTSGGIGGGNATPTSHCDGSSVAGGGAPPSVPSGSQEDTNGSTPQPQLHSQQQALNSLEADTDFLDSFDTKDGGRSHFVPTMIKSTVAHGIKNGSKEGILVCHGRGAHSGTRT